MILVMMTLSDIIKGIVAEEKIALDWVHNNYNSNDTFMFSSKNSTDDKDPGIIVSNVSCNVLIGNFIGGPLVEISMSDPHSVTRFKKELKKTMFKANMYHLQNKPNMVKMELSWYDLLEAKLSEEEQEY